MKSNRRLIWVKAVAFSLLLVSTTAATVIADTDIAEPSNEPASMFLAGIGLIGFAALVRRRLIK